MRCLKEGRPSAGKCHQYLHFEIIVISGSATGSSMLFKRALSNTSCVFSYLDVTCSGTNHSSPLKFAVVRLP
jgi:hypothetical protein